MGVYWRTITKKNTKIFSSPSLIFLVDQLTHKKQHAKESHASSFQLSASICLRPRPRDVATITSSLQKITLDLPYYNILRRRAKLSFKYVYQNSIYFIFYQFLTYSFSVHMGIFFFTDLLLGNPKAQAPF